MWKKRLKRTGKALYTGSIKAGKAADTGLKKYNAWTEKREKMEIKKLNRQIALESKRAKLEKLRNRKRKSSDPYAGLY